MISGNFIKSTILIAREKRGGDNDLAGLMQNKSIMVILPALIQLSYFAQGVIKAETGANIKSETGSKGFKAMKDVDNQKTAFEYWQTNAVADRIIDACSVYENSGINPGSISNTLYKRMAI
ncbi:MAG: hypothetical protein WCP32_18830 [Bacteroidota bacterium]